MASEFATVRRAVGTVPRWFVKYYGFHICLADRRSVPQGPRKTAGYQRGELATRGASLAGL